MAGKLEARFLSLKARERRGNKEQETTQEVSKGQNTGRMGMYKPRTYCFLNGYHMQINDILCVLDTSDQAKVKHQLVAVGKDKPGMELNLTEHS